MLSSTRLTMSSTSSFGTWLSLLVDVDRPRLSLERLVSCKGRSRHCLAIWPVFPQRKQLPRGKGCCRGKSRRFSRSTARATSRRPVDADLGVLGSAAVAGVVNVGIGIGEIGVAGANDLAGPPGVIGCAIGWATEGPVTEIKDPIGAGGTFIIHCDAWPDACQAGVAIGIMNRRWNSSSMVFATWSTFSIESKSSADFFQISSWRCSCRARMNEWQSAEVGLAPRASPNR